jgi:hypothetical protein
LPHGGDDRSDILPTSPDVFAAVAATLGHVNPGVRDEVQAFFRDTYPAMPEPARDLISDFLFAAETMPTGEALGRLREAVDAVAIQAEDHPRRARADGPATRGERRVRDITNRIRTK